MFTTILVDSITLLRKWNVIYSLILNYQFVREIIKTREIKRFC